MKSFLPLFTGCLFAALSTASATDYAGNGATGFGGAVGGGILSVTSSGTTLNFTFTAGMTNGLNGNDLALYFDTTTGGFASTANFTDDGSSAPGSTGADGGRISLSGFDSFNNNGIGSRTTLTFPTGFTADYGISIADGFVGAFQLTTGGPFTYKNNGNLVHTGNTYTFTFQLADLGLTAANFRFVGSLISPTAYRANETIGASTTTPDPTDVNAAPNAGFNGTQAISAAGVFVVPEPSSWVGLGLGSVALIGVAFRRARRVEAA